MAYKRKFGDSSSNIYAAGRVIKPNFTVGETLKEYNLEDEIKALKHDFKVKENEEIQVKFPKTNMMSRTPGIFTEGRDILTKPLQTRYQQLIEDLKDTSYRSYWTKNLGTTIDPTDGFPIGTEIKEITFGKPNKYEVSVKDLIQPYQDLCNQVIHDTNKKIYRSYNPGERIDRKYNSPPFNPNQTFGKTGSNDKRGLKSKCCLTWFNTNPVSVCNEIQADWMVRAKKELGKCNVHEDIKNITLGKPNQRDGYGVEDLLREPNTPVPVYVKNIKNWISSLNRLKIQIEEKRKHSFDQNFLRDRMRNYDQNHSGSIEFSSFIKLMKQYELYFNIDNLKNLMEYLGIIVNDNIDYGKFWDTIDGDLKLNKINDLSSDKICFTSTYQAACCDFLIPDRNLARSTAGLPSKRFDEIEPSERYISLSDYSNVKSCINPSIFTQYSLSHRDFFLPRDELFIRTLLKNSGIHITDENFEKLWKIGVAQDKSNDNKVSVQSFLELFKKYFPTDKNLKIDEILC